MTQGFWRGAFGVAVLWQFAALYWPTTPSVASGLPLDKVVHFLLFAVVAALGLRAGLRSSWVTGLLIAQAVLSETVQWVFLPNRGGDLLDLAADLLGIAAGLALGHWWLGRIQPG